MSNWQLQFNLPANESVTNAWSAQLAQTGAQYTLTPASYNGTIAPGDSVTVGFQATQTGSYAPPTNLLLNGQPVTGAVRPEAAPRAAVPPGAGRPAAGRPAAAPPVAAPAAW